MFRLCVFVGRRIVKAVQAETGLVEEKTNLPFVSLIGGLDRKNLWGLNATLEPHHPGTDTDGGGARKAAKRTQRGSRVPGFPGGWRGPGLSVRDSKAAVLRLTLNR